MRELDHQVAFFHALLRHIERHPVVRQTRPAQHQMAGLERPDPVAHEGLARGLRDEVQFVLVMEVPARQRRGVAVHQAAHKAGLFGRFVAQLGRP
jgi:hypothetical protein